jgi:hypothetical protein
MCYSLFSCRSFFFFFSPPVTNFLEMIFFFFLLFFFRDNASSYLSTPQGRTRAQSLHDTCARERCASDGAVQSRLCGGGGRQFLQGRRRRRDEQALQATRTTTCTRASSLQVPWYVIAGNHDHKGSVDGADSVHGLVESRWNFPDYFYTFNQSFVSTHQRPTTSLCSLS